MNPNPGRSDVMTSDTAAARLYRFIARCVDIGAKSPQTQKEAFASLLDLGDADDATVLFKIGEISRMFIDAREEFQQLASDMDVNDHISLLAEFLTVFTNISLGGQWNNISNRLNPGSIKGLKFAAGHVAHAKRTVVLAPEKLAEIRRQLDETIRTVEESPLDPELRQLLIKELQLVVEMVRGYQFLGAKGLERACDEALGVLFRKWQAGEVPQEEPAIKGYLKTISEIATVAGAAKVVFELGEHVYKAFTGGKGPS